MAIEEGSVRSSEVVQPKEEADEDEMEYLCPWLRPRAEGTRAGTSAASVVDERYGEA
jgi:hypothetical protein